MLSTGGGAPTALGITPDGRRLFWLSAYGVLRMADATTLEQLPELSRPRVTKPGEEPEYVIGISRDGTRYASVASVDIRETVIVQEGDEKCGLVWEGGATPGSKPHPDQADRNRWNHCQAFVRPWTRKGTLVTRTLPPFRERDLGIPLPVSAVFSQDGGYVTTWSSGNVLNVHDIATGRSIAELRGHQNTITSGEFSPDARHFVSGSYDGTVRIWNLADRRRRKGDHARKTHLGCGVQPGRPMGGVWWLGRSCQTLERHGPIGRQGFVAIQAGSWHSPSRRTASGWWLRPQIGPFVSGLRPGESQPYASATRTQSPAWRLRHRDGSSCRAASITPFACGIPIAHPFQCRTSRTATTASHCAQSEREQVATAGSDGFIRVWERRNPSQVTAFQRRGPKAIGLDFTDLTFTTDGSRLVVLGPDEVRVWDPLTAEALTTRAWPEPLRRASLLPDGQRVIELTTDGALRIWNVEGTDAPANLSPGFERQPDGPLVASFNNERIAVGTARQLGLWDIRRRTRLLLVDLNALDIGLVSAPLRSAQTEGRVASGHEDGTIRFWDVASGRMLQQFMGHDGPVQWLVFNPIGTRLVSAAAISDRKVRIWRAHPQSVVAISNRPTSTVWIGEPLPTLEHENAVQALAMSTDGTTIATLEQVCTSGMATHCLRRKRDSRLSCCANGG